MNNIIALNSLINNRQSEIYYIEAALNNLKAVCSLQAKDKKSEYVENTIQMIQTLHYRVEDLKIEIASFEREIKRLKQHDNDQVAMSMGYL
jgi:hypothetical protein